MTEGGSLEDLRRRVGALEALLGDLDREDFVALLAFCRALRSAPPEALLVYHDFMAGWIKRYADATPVGYG